MNLLDCIPTGRDNAISRKDLAAYSGLPDRLMRNQIEELRKHVPVLNLQDGNGYFQPGIEEFELVKIWVRQQKSRSRSIENSTLGAEKWIAEQFAASGERITLVRQHLRRMDRKKEVEGQLTL